MAKINLGRVRGDSFKFEDLTQEQLEQLKGGPGQAGPPGRDGAPGPTVPISDSITSVDSGVAASSKAVKTAYDKAVTVESSLESSLEVLQETVSALHATVAAIMPFAVSESASEDTSRLWIRPSDRTLYYHDGTGWKPIVGVYAETTGP